MIQKVSVTLCKKYREKGNTGMLWQTILITFILLTLVLVELALDGEGLPLCQCKILVKID